MTSPSDTILVVEDNEDDIFALKWMLKRASITNPLQIVTDGQKAVSYLSGKPPYSDRAAHPMPVVVLLDLKLPYLSGMEVLAWIRQESPVPELPVVLLSGSDEARDHANGENLGIHRYLVKPATAEQLTEVLDSLR